MALVAYKTLPGLSFMMDNQTAGIMFDFSQLCTLQIIFIDNGLCLLVVNNLIAESIIL